MDIDGRYPDKATSFDPKTMIVHCRKRTDGTILVRLDDSNHLEFWIEVIIEPEEIASD